MSKLRSVNFWLGLAGGALLVWMGAGIGSRLTEMLWVLL